MTTAPATSFAAYEAAGIHRKLVREVNRNTKEAEQIALRALGLPEIAKKGANTAADRVRVFLVALRFRTLLDGTPVGHHLPGSKEHKAMPPVDHWTPARLRETAREMANPVAWANRAAAFAMQESRVLEAY